MTDKPTTSSAAEFALQALVAAGHVSQELVDRALALPGAPQPAHRGEPVAWKHDCAALLTNDVELWIDACPHCGKPRNAPQPVEREPLTPEQVVDAFCKRPHTVQFVEAFINGVRFAERHHGIKGGQHGTDT